MQNKISVRLIGLVLLLVTPRLLPAQMSGYDVQVQCLKVLPPEAWHYDPEVKTLQFFSDANDSLIVFCRARFPYSRNVGFVFLNKENKWLESEKTYEGNLEAVVSNGQFKLVTFASPENRQKPLEVFDATKDFQISSEPRLVLNLSSSPRFKRESEVEYRELYSIAGADQPDSFLVLGDYSASNLNPLTFIGLIISAGHAGTVHLPFASQITNGKIAGFYNIPTKYNDNDDVRYMYGTVVEKTAHVVWVQLRNYSTAADKIMYAQFNLDTHEWSDVSEIFGGLKKDKGEYGLYSKQPTLAVSKDGIVHCSWAYTYMSELFAQPMKVKIGETGVFYRKRGANGWSPIEKIGDSAAYQSKISIGKDQIVHVFWADYYKKMYHTYKNENGWQEPRIVYEDPNMEWFVPFDAKVDLKENFHLAYIRAFPVQKVNKKSTKKPDELVYVKISKDKL